MTNPGGFDPDEVIIDGLTNFAEATKDGSAVGLVDTGFH